MIWLHSTNVKACFYVSIDKHSCPILVKRNYKVTGISLSFSFPIYWLHIPIWGGSCPPCPLGRNSYAPPATHPTPFSLMFKLQKSFWNRTYVSNHAKSDVIRYSVSSWSQFLHFSLLLLHGKKVRCPRNLTPGIKGLVHL